MHIVRYIQLLIYLTAGPAFVISFAAYLCLNHKMKKKYDSDLDEYYHEFEDVHPAIVRYDKWSRITLALACLSALLLFIGLVL